MFSKVLFVITSVFISHAFSTEMNSCINSKGIYPNVTYSANSYVCESSPCDCILKCPAVITVDFIAPRYLENLKPNVHVSAMGVEIDFDMGQDDACTGFTNTQCPIVKNEKVNYKYELYIPPVPQVAVTLTFSLVDKDLDEDVICFSFDIVVKKIACPP